MELKETRIVHRFIRDIADYEIGGEYYNQVIPLDTQAFAIYPEHTDKKGIWYVFGDGIHTYIELRDGLGNKESANEFPVFTDADIALIHSKADNARMNELFAQFDTKKANKADVYTQTELNNKFAEVNAAINSEEEARTAADEQLQANIDTKANKADVYTKTEVDAKVSSVYRFKGNVAKVADLPTEGNVVGDVYNVSSTGSNYAWNGTEWDKLSETLDLTPYLLREDAEETYETISNVNTLNETLNQKIEQEILRATAAEGSVLESAKEYTDTVATTKANVIDVYNKDEIDTKVSDINTSIVNESTARAEADDVLRATLELKANKSDVYTKAETDTRVNNEKTARENADQELYSLLYTHGTALNKEIEDRKAADTAIQTQVTTLEASKADKSDVFSKSEATTIFYQKQKWIDETLGIKSAEEFAVQNAFTGTIAGEQETFSAAVNVLDNAIVENQTEISKKADASAVFSKTEATNIFYQKQKWIDETLGIKSAEEFAVKNAFTGEIAGEQETFSGAINVLDEQITTNIANIDKKADKDSVFSKDEATSIFYQKQKWIDETLGIKSAEEFAVKNAFTGDIAGEQDTFSAAINVLDNAITEDRAILAEKADSADVFSKNEATNIFYQKQAWIDSTLGIKSAEENAVKNAFTGEIAGEESTFSGAVNALDTAIVDNRTNLDTRATNIDLNSLLNRLNTLEDKVLDLQAANQTEATVDTGAIIVPEGATDVKVSGTASNPVAISEASTVTAETLSINHMDATSTADNLACFVLNSDEVTINNTTFAGEYISSTEKSKNMLYVKNTETAEEASVVMKNTTITADSLGYNCILIDHTNLKSVTIDNVDFLGTLNNNAISVFEMNDNGVINISNCDFNVVSNVFRFSNRGNNKNIVINISNCTCNQWESYADYAGIICLQDYTSKTVDEAVSANLFAPDKITINISNFVYNGVRMTKDDIANVCYVFRDIENKTDSSKGNYRYSEDNLYMFPTINII